MKIASLVFFLLGIAGVFASLTVPLAESLPQTVLFFILSFAFWLKHRANSKKHVHQHKIDQTSFPSSLITVSSEMDVPDYVYSAMRKGYTEIQVQDDTRILLDCYQLCRSSTNLETILMRTELGNVKALSLQQASQAGICNISHLSEPLSYFKGNSEAIITQGLQNCWQKQKNEITALKTPSGKKNRLKKFLEESNRILLPVIYDDDKTVLYDDLLEAWRAIKSEARELEAAI